MDEAFDPEKITGYLVKPYSQLVDLIGKEKAQALAVNCDYNYHTISGKVTDLTLNDLFFNLPKDHI